MLFRSASSIYYFLLKPDGRTLTYWAKYTGVIPISVPHSALSYKIGIETNVEFSINYIYSFKEEMGLDILHEFNQVSKQEIHSGKTGVSGKVGPGMPVWIDSVVIDKTIGSRKSYGYTLNFAKEYADKFVGFTTSKFRVGDDIPGKSIDYSKSGGSSGASSAPHPL